MGGYGTLPFVVIVTSTTGSFCCTMLLYGGGPHVESDGCGAICPIEDGWRAMARLLPRLT